MIFTDAALHTAAKYFLCAGMQGYSYVPPHDDEALMEAVYSRGTVAISLDASQPSFRFYASGPSSDFFQLSSLFCRCNSELWTQ